MRSETDQIMTRRAHLTLRVMMSEEPDLAQTVGNIVRAHPEIDWYEKRTWQEWEREYLDP